MIYYETHSDIRVKCYCRLNLLGSSILISSVSIYYGTQSDIRVKTYFRFIFLDSSIFNLERLDIFWDSIWHPCKNLLHFEFDRSFCFQILSLSIYKGTQSCIRVKGYRCLNLLRDCIFNFEHLDIWRDSFKHPSKKLLPFEFAGSFLF